MRVRRRRVVEAAARQTLEIPHGVVGGVADQAAGERHSRQIGLRLRRLHERRAQGIQEFDPRSRPRPVRSADLEARRIDFHLQAFAESNERIARQPLAALDAFQQESRSKGCQLQIGRHRRIEIGCDVKWRLHAHG